MAPPTGGVGVGGGVGGNDYRSGGLGGHEAGGHQDGGENGDVVGAGGAGSAPAGGRAGHQDPGGGAGGGPGGASPGGGLALLLSIDFIGGRTTTNSAGATTVKAAAAMEPTETAGVKAAARWNGALGAVGSLPTLTLSNGDVTAASVFWSCPPGTSGPGVWTKTYLDAPGDVRMMNGYLDPLNAATPATVVVTGLPDAIIASGYDVYVYTSGDIRSADTRVGRYAIGTTSLSASELGPTPTTFDGFRLATASSPGNYLVFRNLTTASFTLTATPGTTQPTRAPVNGIQIVSPAGS